ncbi:hypothetical protein [Tropicimonas sp. S265A]|uniref:hypothetical protein n=1 Tax=Tropicimonas sp. S265A TaxID=3415134 RepID=UPI003C7E004D
MQFFWIIGLLALGAMAAPKATHASHVTWTFTSTVNQATWDFHSAWSCDPADYAFGGSVPHWCGQDPTILAAGTTGSGFLTYDTLNQSIFACDLGLDPSGSALGDGGSLDCEGIASGFPSWAKKSIAYDSLAPSLEAKSQIADGSILGHEIKIGPDGGQYSWVSDFSPEYIYVDVVLSNVSVSLVPIGPSGLLSVSGLLALVAVGRRTARSRRARA